MVLAREGLAGQGGGSRAFADLCQVSNRGRRGRTHQEPREEGEVQTGHASRCHNHQKTALRAGVLKRPSVVNRAALAKKSVRSAQEDRTFTSAAQRGCCSAHFCNPPGNS